MARPPAVTGIPESGRRGPPPWKKAGRGAVRAGRHPFFLPLKRTSRQSAAAYGNGAWKLFGESPLPEGVEAFVLLGRPWRKGGCIVRIIRRLGYGGT